jgi:hypothetical protein
VKLVHLVGFIIQSCKRISVEWVQFSRSKGGMMKRGCGTELEKYCMFYCEQGNETRQVAAGYSILERIISSVKIVEFVGNRMLYIVLKGLLV